MLKYVNPLDQIAVSRLLEFLSDKKPWHRSLWGVSVVLAMEELCEACVALREGYLSEAAVKRMASALQKRMGKHPAFSDEEKLFLRQQLHQVPRAEGAAHFGIRELSCRVTTDYLKRWGQAAVAGTFSIEHFARSVASYLLDQGFSGKYLYSFTRARLDSPEPISLTELCDALHAEMLESPRREFKVLLAFTSLPALPNGIPSSWLRGQAVTAWLKDRNFDTTGVRAAAGVVLNVQARDVMGAAQAARNESDRYASRALIATGKPLNRLPMLWVEGSAAPASMMDTPRGVSVRELFREDRVFSTDANESVDAALELLAHLEESSPPAAVAGGWAAIEGLLADPSDRASAADNLATLVTCSLPRAELTVLSYRAERHHPEQCRELEGVRNNRDRCRILAKMIVDGRMPTMPDMADQAAATRMSKILANPGRELQTIREAIGESFHRLYRQRNLILHGARLDSVALTASLRTVAKLVGAGMDRITHGHYVQGRQPLELVAKANLELAVISKDFPWRCVDLLEAD